MNEQNENKTLKERLADRFNELYKGKRLLAIQLNGFTHSVFYDNGKADDRIILETHSGYIGAGDSEVAGKLFAGIGHSCYQYEPEELVYVMPNDR